MVSHGDAEGENETGAGLRGAADLLIGFVTLDCVMTCRGYLCRFFPMPRPRPESNLKHTKSANCCIVEMVSICPCARVHLNHIKTRTPPNRRCRLCLCSSLRTAFSGHSAAPQALLYFPNIVFSSLPFSKHNRSSHLNKSILNNIFRLDRLHLAQRVRYH